MVNVKTVKKGALILATIGLTVGLAGCGNEATKSSSSDDKDKPTVTDILNADKERQIIATSDKGVTDSPKVEWAGIIGNGKIEMHPYTNKDDIELSQLDRLSMNKFKSKLKEEDKDYENYGDNQKLKIYPRHAKTLLQTNNSNKAERIGFIMKDDWMSNRYDKSSLYKPEYSKILKSTPDGWLGIKDDGNTDMHTYTLYIKSAKKEKGLSFEDTKKAKKNYDNVKIKNDYDE